VVADAGEALCAGAGKPLNMPEPVRVEADAGGLPQAIRGKRRQPVAYVEDRWRLDDEWWRTGPVSRLYYAVRLASGQKLVVYQDLVTGGWYRQSY